MSKALKQNTLAHALQDFFEDHLPRLRGMSPNTIHSYRDCLVMLLRYAAKQEQCPITKLEMDHINAKRILGFLQMLEDKRGNKPTTRNIRLAAIHSFFRYFSYQHPEKMEYCQKILAVPFKRESHRAVEYLEYDEIQAILNSIDRSHKDGERDYTLLATMFNTGARVQEILDLRICDLQLFKPYSARLMGKGRKERMCPLWPQTARLLKNLLKHRSSKNESVFLNHQGEPLSRFGVRYLLKKYCDFAKEKKPSLANKRLHPHSMRHSTVVHLLKSGVDIVTISHWLGHADINTTNRYATIDLDAKRKVINKIALKDGIKNPKAIWRSNNSILEWLESL